MVKEVILVVTRSGEVSGMRIKFLTLLFWFVPTLVLSQTDYIPSKAFNYRDTIWKEIENYFPELYNYNYVPSLAEHESCITLKHKRCFEPSSQLLSKREQGVGLFQTTRAFREDGSLRFDTLTEMRNRYKAELKEASWSTYKNRPDLQIRAAILMLRDDYKKLYAVENPVHRMHMVDAAYNGGMGGLLKERRACGMAKNCDPNIWFNNVERYCLKSKKVLYGNRSACDINRHHVKDVFYNNLPKYDRDYFNKEYLEQKKLSTWK